MAMSMVTTIPMNKYKGINIVIPEATNSDNYEELKKCLEKFYKTELSEKFNLNPKFFDKLLAKLKEEGYFNDNTISKIKIITLLLKNKKYNEIQKLANKIYGEIFMSSLKVEDIYNKNKKGDPPNTYYHNRLILFRTFKNMIPIFKNLKDKKSGKGKKSKKRKGIKTGGTLRKAKSLSKAKKSNSSKYIRYFSDYDKQNKKLFEKYLNANNTCNNKGEECCMCLVNMEDNHSLFRCSNCKNCMHLKCMHKYYYEKDTYGFKCPLCKYNVPKEIETLFDKIKYPTRAEIKTMISSNDLGDFDPDHYVHGPPDNSVPLAMVEVVLIGVFALPIFGLTGGLLDPITTSTLIHQTLSLGLSTTVIHPMLRN